MQFDTLQAISPIDGRYRGQTKELAAYFSEEALIRYRIRVEVEYFIALCNIPLKGLESPGAAALEHLRRLYLDFNPEYAKEVKAIEKTTNHDVKAVEYFLKAKLEQAGLSAQREFIHFGLTSQDINNTAIPLSLREALEAVFDPGLQAVMDKIQQLAEDWWNIPMLARTHGQPASPTRLGKELFVFHERLAGQRALLDAVPYMAKFGGATGNFNAHVAAYPQVDWIDFSDRFIGGLGLRRSLYTTQIEHYDNLAALFDAIKRINTVLIDLCRDIWTYVSMNYFDQKVIAGETGSSAMPHKVNPIDFENAEGNLGMANAILEHLAGKLPISRLQRDLTDSTVLRNIGVPMAHTVIAFRSIQKGLDKITVNPKAIENDLENNWAVVAEAIQTILRREGYPQPYEALKALTRTGKPVDRDSITVFINGLAIDEEIRKELLGITPFNYTGTVKPLS